MWKDGSDYEVIEYARWVQGGDDYFTLLERLINEAQKSIRLYVYILTPDETGTRILALLQEAAIRGVKVNLLVDDFGSDELDEAVVQNMVESGIRFGRFEPIFSTSNLYLGRRMHAKVLVTDEEHALIGGVNIANRYKGSAEHTAWLDYAIYLKGSLVQRIEKSCVEMLKPLQSVRVPKLVKSAIPVPTADPSLLLARVRVNDFLRNRREIARSYNQAMRAAERSVIIVGGYFLPGGKFRRLLRDAVRRKVSVNVILTKQSDVPITRLASEYLYGYLLRKGIRIFEYRHSMVHGKAAVVDGTWTTIGSYNQNHLSAYLSIELNIDVVNTAFAGSLETYLQELIRNDCDEIILETYAEKAGAFTKLKRWTSYRLVRISLRFLFFVNHINSIDD